MPIAELENVKCPKCKGPMVSRKSSHGIFWGCKAWPRCDGKRDSMGRSPEEYKKERNNFKEDEDGDSQR